MLNLGWKKKVLHLKMVLLTAGHQPAKTMPPMLERIIDCYRRANGGDIDAVGDLQALTKSPPSKEDEALAPLWEPLDLYGWTMRATFYLKDKDLWWLFHAQRKTSVPPSEKEVGFLEKAVELLGGDVTRHVIIGPRSPASSGPGLLGFGWWTWKNLEPLLEMQVKKDGKKVDTRIVPSGTRPTDGFQHIDLKPGGPAESEPI